MKRREQPKAHIAEDGIPADVLEPDVGEKPWREWMNTRRAWLDEMDIPLTEQCRLIPHRGPRW